jgi:hypothetical protein
MISRFGTFGDWQSQVVFNTLLFHLLQMNGSCCCVHVGLMSALASFDMPHDVACCQRNGMCIVGCAALV